MPSRSSLPDYYEILGVSPDASVTEIRTAYKKKSLLNHPDRVQGDAEAKEKATNEFQKISDAFYVLSDSSRRESYDRLRASSSSSNSEKQSNTFPGDFSNPDPDETFANVFEDMLRPEVERTVPVWTMVGAVSGAGLGFISGNLPGAAIGAFAGSRLGKIRDAKGKAVYQVFQELGGEEKAAILRTLALKVLGAAVS